MEVTVLSAAAAIAVACIVLIWRETRVRQRARGYYVAPITQYRRELSRSGIITAITAVIWVWLMPSSVWPAALAFFPAFLYLFVMFTPPQE
jgi:ABC-type Fe3+ transport system permease subunit